MKARDYLVSKNLAKPGRGKFSGAARDALLDALNKGETFDDYKVEGGVLVKKVLDKAPAPVRTARTAEVQAAPAEPKRAPKVQTSDVLEVPAQVWPEGESHATFNDTGKPCSMKNACNNCGTSLFWCHCGSPRVFDRPVTIALGK